MNRAPRGSLPERWFVLVAVLAASAAVAVAAPRVTGVQGTVQNGQNITITGAEFGATGPTVVLFDDFEKATADGQEITLDSPQVGRWSEVCDPAGVAPQHSSLYVHGGRFSARFDSGLEPVQGYCGNVYNQLGLDLPRVRDVFFSYWRFIPPGDHVPGYGNSNGVNWKWIWIMGDGPSDDDLFTATQDDNGGTGDTWPSQGGNNRNLTGADICTGYYESKFTQGRWVRAQHWIHVQSTGQSDGQFHLWEIPWESVADPDPNCPTGYYNSSGDMLRINWNNITVLHDTACGSAPCSVFERINLFGYGRQTANSHPTYDDFYLATGANARARVELASARTWGDDAYALTMNMTLCTPTAWSTGQVTCTVRQGAFANGATAYLFVIDGAGNVSDQDASTPGAQGFQVTIGTGGAPNEPPTTPDGARRTDTR